MNNGESATDVCTDLTRNQIIWERERERVSLLWLIENRFKQPKNL